MRASATPCASGRARPEPALRWAHEHRAASPNADDDRALERRPRGQVRALPPTSSSAPSDIHSRGPLERAGLQPDDARARRRLWLRRDDPADRRARRAERIGRRNPLLRALPRRPRAPTPPRPVYATSPSSSPTPRCAQFAHEFELAFARFGTMFFPNPTAAMRNIRTALAPGGRLLMVVWRADRGQPVAVLRAKTVAQRTCPRSRTSRRAAAPGPSRCPTPTS